MLDERKSALLQAAVAEYIRTAQPVGSSALADRVDLSVSAATVRNELAALEREGYLTHPHTSAGRVPTESGYRFFVDSFSNSTATLPAPLAAEIESFFSSAYNELEDMLQETTQLLSHVTQCAAVVVQPTHEQAVALSVQLVPLNTSHVLVVVVLSNGSVEKRALEVQVNDKTARAASEVLGRSLVNHDLKSSAEPPNSGDEVVDNIVAVCLSALRNETPGEQDRAYVGGTAAVVSKFDALENARHVLDALEQQYVVVSLLRDVMARGENVAIGSEHGLDSLKDCSIVVAPFGGEKSSSGTLGVVGPTRMDYKTALAAISEISEQLSRRIAEG